MGITAASPQVGATDETTGGLIVVDFEHHEIHEGDHFFVAGVTAMGLNGTIDFLFTTPNTTKWSHMTFSILGNAGGVNIKMYESANTSGGTAVTAINNNRNSAVTSTATVKTNPTTITTLGTLIYEAESGVNRGAGFIDRAREIVLKQNTSYVFRITSLAAANNVSYAGEWYEHTNL